MSVEGCDKEQYALGIVVTTSPTCSRYRMVVFPAPSNPRIRILISLVPNRPEKRLEKNPPVEKWIGVWRETFIQLYSCLGRKSRSVWTQTKWKLRKLKVADVRFFSATPKCYFSYFCQATSKAEFVSWLIWTTGLNLPSSRIHNSPMSLICGIAGRVRLTMFSLVAS